MAGIKEIGEKQHDVNSIDVYHYVANLLTQQNKDPYEVKQALVNNGIEPQEADRIIYEVEQQTNKIKNEAANKDMLWGAVWCIGGTIGTLANTGFIFWGAIIFGGIQFFKGVSNRV